MRLDYEILYRHYDNFEEDLPQEGDIKEQQLGDTSTPTSPAIEFLEEGDEVVSLPTFCRVKGTKRSKVIKFGNLWSMIGFKVLLLAINTSKL